MLDKDAKTRLKEIAFQHSTTLFVVMFSAYILMLFRFSKQENISCSIIAAGREHASLYDVIGFFVISILFKINVDKQEHFLEFLSRVHTEVMNCFQHQSYPLENVCSELKIPPPELPVSFNMLNIRDTEILQELEYFQSHHIEGVSDIKFVIELYVKEYDNGIDLNWRYKKKNFAPETIEYIIGEYLGIIDFFIKDRGKNVEDFCKRTQKRFFGLKKGELSQC
jgi:non-ribosomal peptide synthetase component F